MLRDVDLRDLFQEWNEKYQVARNLISRLSLVREQALAHGLTDEDLAKCNGGGGGGDSQDKEGDSTSLGGDEGPAPLGSDEDLAPLGGDEGPDMDMGDSLEATKLPPKNSRSDILCLTCTPPVGTR